jgi:hypothetical protein
VAERDNLQRHGAFEPFVVRTINDGLTAAANFFDQLIMPKHARRGTRLGFTRAAVESSFQQARPTFGLIAKYRSAALWTRAFGLC